MIGIMNHINRQFLLVAVAISSLALVGCINVKTGHSGEEARGFSSDRASTIRSDFAGQLNRASAGEKVRLILRHAEFVQGQYVKYSVNIASQWHDAEQGRGETVPAEEMRQMINAWTEKERPILKAWDDNLELAWDQIKQESFFDQTMFEALEEVIRMYYEVYSAVMFPVSNTYEYVDRVLFTVSEANQAKADAEFELRRYE